jgi:multidrug efflux pump subunit AcrA (membrane-fusion protein)
MNRLTPNMIPAQQILEDRLKRVQAQKQYERALYDLNVIRPAETNVKEQELAIAQTRLGQRRLISPIDGIVETIHGHEGMWFREGQEILRITQYHTLKVMGKVSIQHATPRMINGKTVEVIPESQGREPSPTFTGKVIFASQTIGADRAFDIHVEVKNQLQDGYWLLNPGRFVELRIKL